MEERDGVPSFDLLVKKHALKILLDYRAITKSGWTVIRREIIESCGLEADSTLLTRQDLENWANYKSILGDQKFRLVHHFLLTASSRGRPEFEGIEDRLRPNYRMMRTGRVLGELYGTYRPELLGQYQGLFLSDFSDGRFTALFIEKVEGEDFSLVHVFRPRAGQEYAAGDWGLERQSGYLVFGPQIGLHVRDITNGLWYTRFFLPQPIDGASYRVNDAPGVPIYLLGTQAETDILQVDAGMRKDFLGRVPLSTKLTPSIHSDILSIVESFKGIVPL